MSYYIGIDPGVGGAAVALDENGNVACVQPWDGEESFIDFIEIYAMRTKLAILEKVNAFPGQGVASTWKFAENYGFIKGVLRSHRATWDLVLPTQWQSHLCLPKAASKSRHKANLKDTASRLLPSHRWTLTTADAALLALYALRRSQNALPAAAGKP